MVPFFSKLAERLNEKFSKTRIDQIHLVYIVAYVCFITLHKLVAYNVYLPYMLDVVLASFFAIAGALLIVYDFLSGRIPLYSRITLCMLRFQPWKRARSNIPRSPANIYALQCHLACGRLNLLLDVRDHAGRICDANGWILTKIWVY